MIFVLLWAGVINNGISKTYTIQGGSWCDGGESSGQDCKVVIWGVTSELIAHIWRSEPRAWGVSWWSWRLRSELSRKKSVLSVSADKGGWGCDLSQESVRMFSRTQSFGSLLYQWYGMWKPKKFGLICKKGKLCLTDESVTCSCFRSHRNVCGS